MTKEKKAEKVSKIIRTVFAITCLAGMLSVYAYAAPSGVDTKFSKNLTDIALWVARLLIGFGGGIPAINSIVDGINNENPSKRNHGITGVVATGAGIAATFALPSLFNF